MEYRTRSNTWLFPALSAAVCLLLYLLTMAPGLTWEHYGADGGDLIAAASVLGVPHPPGYPVYILIARLFLRIPLHDPAWRLNLYSACAASGIVFAMCDLIQRLLPEQETITTRLIPFSTAIAAGTASLLWSQAIITEVYALANLFAILTLRQTILIKNQSHSRWLLIGLWQSLAILCHPTMVLLIPGILVILWPRLTPSRIRHALLGLALGFLPLVYLPLAAVRHPSINWGDPSTLAGFIWLISGKAYQSLAFSLPLAGLVARLGALANLILSQYGIVGTTLAILGIGYHDGQKKRLLPATGLIMLAFSLFSIGYATSDSMMYLLPTFLVQSLWIAFGLARVTQYIKKHGHALGILCVLILPLLTTSQHYRQLDLSENTEAITWYTETLKNVPQEGLVITCDDRHTFALAYAQQSLLLRRDILVIDADLWQQEWYARSIIEREELPTWLIDLSCKEALPYIRANIPQTMLCNHPDLAMQSGH